MSTTISKSCLIVAGIAREPLVDHGLKFIRRQEPVQRILFHRQSFAEPVSAWVPIASPCRSAVMMDPMTARTGVASIRVEGERAEVHLQMQPGETRVLRAFPEKDGRRPRLADPGTVG